MSEQLNLSQPSSLRPWHLWVVGCLTLVWNGSGAYAFLMAQTGNLTNLTAEESMYYAEQAWWLVFLIDLAVITPVAAGVGILLRSRAAVWLFGLSLALIVFSNFYELVSRTSLMLFDRSAIVLTSVVLLIAVLQFAYAKVLHNRGFLQ